MQFLKPHPEQTLMDSTVSMLLKTPGVVGQMPILQEPQAQKNLRDALNKAELLAYNLTATSSQQSKVLIGSAGAHQVIMDGKMVPLKDGPGDYSARSLERFDPKRREAKLKKLNFADILPVNNLADPAVTAETYEMSFPIIEAKEQYSEHGQKSNQIDVIVKEFTSTVKREDVEFVLTYDDIQAMARTRRINQVERKIRVAYRAYQEKAQARFMLGDATQGVKGFTNHAYMPGAAISQGGKTTIASMLPEEQIKFFNSLITQVYMATGMNHSPNALCLAPNIWSTLFNQIVDFQYRRVLEYLLDQLGGMGYREIHPCFELQATGVNAKDQVIAYEKSIENMEATILQDLTWIPQQPVGSSIKFTGTFKLGEYKSFFPLSALRAYEQ